jgi:hypothetical protein
VQYDLDKNVRIANQFYTSHPVDQCSDREKAHYLRPLFRAVGRESTVRSVQLMKFKLNSLNSNLSTARIDETIKI